MIRDVAVAIVNKDLLSNNAIQEQTKIKLFIVDQILKMLDLNGHIKLSRNMGNHNHIYHVSPTLKRGLNSM